MTNVFDLLPGNPFDSGLRRNAIAAGAGTGGSVRTLAESIAGRAQGRYDSIARDDDGQVRGRVRSDPASGRRVLDAGELRARIELRSTERVTGEDWANAAAILAAHYPQPAPEPVPEPGPAPDTGRSATAPKPGSWLRGRR